MKLRQILIALMLCISFTVLGLQPNNAPAQQQSQQKTVEQLHKENEELQKQFDRLEKEVEIYRGDIRSKIPELDEQQGRWADFIFFIVGLIAGALGVLAPYLFSKEIKKEFRSRMAELGGRIDQASQDAASAMASLSEINRIKEQINEIKDEVDNSKTKAEEAANEAKASEYFSQAVSEKDASKAINLYSSSVELSPNPMAYNNRGILKRLLGDNVGAMNDYNKAINLDPNNEALYLVYSNRGALKAENGDLDGAMDDFNMAISLNSKYENAFNNRGFLKLENKNWPGALEDFNTALKLNPKYADAYNKRAYLLLQMNELDRALNDSNRAILYDSTDFEFYDTRGEIFMKKERYNEAIDDFSTALVLNEESKKVYQKRAQCYSQLAEEVQDDQQKADYLNKAKADEEKAAELP